MRLSQWPGARVIHKGSRLWPERFSTDTLKDMERPTVRSELYPFSYFDPISEVLGEGALQGRVGNLKSRYARWGLEGEPEIREGPLDPRVDPNGPHAD